MKRALAIAALVVGGILALGLDAAYAQAVPPQCAKIRDPHQRTLCLAKANRDAQLKRCNAIQDPRQKAACIKHVRTVEARKLAVLRKQKQQAEARRRALQKRQAEARRRALLKRKQAAARQRALLKKKQQAEAKRRALLKKKLAQNSPQAVQREINATFKSYVSLRSRGLALCRRLQDKGQQLACRKRFSPGPAN